MKSSRLLLSVVLLLCACGSTQTHRVVTGAPRPRFAGVVRIVMEGEPPPSGFAEIAIVQAKGTGGHADLEHVVAGLRAEAARLGCDTVIRVRIDQGEAQASGTGVCGTTSP